MSVRPAVTGARFWNCGKASWLRVALIALPVAVLAAKVASVVGTSWFSTASKRSVGRDQNRSFSFLRMAARWFAASAARSTDSSLAAKSCSSCVFGVSRDIKLNKFPCGNV